VYQGRIIAYSLGNFVFDDVYTARDPKKPLIRLSEANKTGAVASVEIINGKILNWSITPHYLGPDRLTIGADVTGFSMRAYDDALATACTEDYDHKRHALIQQYVESRRALRDLKWYLRRLNTNSIGLILAARRNARNHLELFTSKVHKLGTFQ